MLGIHWPERTQIDFISSMEKHNPLRLIWFQHSWVVYPSHYRNNSFKTIHSSFFPSFIAWPLSRSRETTVANPSSLGGPGGCWEQDSSGSWWKWFEVGQFVLEVYGKCDKKTQLFSAGEQHGSYVCMTAFRKHRHRTYLLWSSGALTLYELWPSVVLVVFYIFISGRKA